MHWPVERKGGMEGKGGMERKGGACAVVRKEGLLAGWSSGPQFAAPPSNASLQQSSNILSSFWLGFSKN